MPVLIIFKKVEESTPSHLTFFVISHGKRNMNKFVHEIDGFNLNTVYFRHTDSLYMHMDYYQK